MTCSVTRRMAIGLTDFLRLLPKITGHPHASDEQNGMVHIPSRNVTLSWRILPSAQLGAIKFPQLELTIQIQSDDDLDKENFMMEFDRVYQRGGG